MLDADSVIARIKQYGRNVPSRLSNRNRWLLDVEVVMEHVSELKYLFEDVVPRDHQELYWKVVKQLQVVGVIDASTDTLGLLSVNGRKIGSYSVTSLEERMKIEEVLGKRYSPIN